MKHAFWIVAIIGLGMVGFVQFSNQEGPERSFLVTGMQPQVDLMREIAKDEGWSITCEGKSGEMTVLRLSPGFFAGANSAEALDERLSLIASSTSGLTRAEAELSTCDVDPPQLSSPDGDYVNPAMAFGTLEMLDPYLEVARSCGFGDAAILPISEVDLARYQADFPDEWFALYAGSNSAKRYGPVTCYTLMSHRLQAADEVG